MFAIMLRVGRWKLTTKGLFRWRQHRSRGPKKNAQGGTDKSLTGSSMGAWFDWDPISKGDYPLATRNKL